MHVNAVQLSSITCEITDNGKQPPESCEFFCDLVQDFRSEHSFAIGPQTDVVSNECMYPNHEQTRSSLLLRLQDAEDIAAWDEFVSIYGPVISRVASQQGFQPADVENIVQEVFMTVTRSLSDWLERKNRGSFRAWLLRITRNTAVDTLTRKATRSLGRNDTDARNLLANLPASDELSSSLDLEYQRMLFEWATQRVRSEVAEQTWQAFFLTTIEGVSVNEAAEKLGIRPGNIYIARSRIMARIKKLVQYYEQSNA